VTVTLRWLSSLHALLPLYIFTLLLCALADTLDHFILTGPHVGAVMVRARPAMLSSPSTVR